MFFYLLLLFTAIPVLELWILIEAGRRIGVLYTVSIVILTGFAGAALARSQGFIVLSRIRSDIDSGLMPADKIFDGVLILAGGLMLLTPGFLTDAAGFFLLIPLSRAFLKTRLRRKIISRYRLESGYIDIEDL